MRIRLPCRGTKRADAPTHNKKRTARGRIPHGAELSRAQRHAGQDDVFRPQPCKVAEQLVQFFFVPIGAVRDTEQIRRLRQTALPHAGNVLNGYNSFHIITSGRYARLSFAFSDDHPMTFALMLIAGTKCGRRHANGAPSLVDVRKSSRSPRVIPRAYPVLRRDRGTSRDNARCRAGMRGSRRSALHSRALRHRHCSYAGR